MADMIQRISRFTLNLHRTFYIVFEFSRKCSSQLQRNTRTVGVWGIVCWNSLPRSYLLGRMPTSVRSAALLSIKRYILWFDLFILSTSKFFLLAHSKIIIDTKLIPVPILLSNLSLTTLFSSFDERLHFCLFSQEQQGTRRNEWRPWRGTSSSNRPQSSRCISNDFSKSLAASMVLFNFWKKNNFIIFRSQHDSQNWRARAFLSAIQHCSILQSECRGK